MITQTLDLPPHMGIILHRISILKKTLRRVVEMVQPVKYLLHKHKDLRWTPSTHAKSQTGWCVYVIPTLERQSQADPWGSLAGQPSLSGKPGASDFVSRNKMGGPSAGTIPGVGLCPPHMYTYRYTNHPPQICTYTYTSTQKPSKTLWVHLEL